MLRLSYCQIELENRLENFGYGRIEVKTAISPQLGDRPLKQML
jgi:hypothetical protein